MQAAVFRRTAAEVQGRAADVALSGPVSSTPFGRLVADIDSSGEPQASLQQLHLDPWSSLSSDQELPSLIATANLCSSSSRNYTLCKIPSHESSFNDLTKRHMINTVVCLIHERIPPLLYNLMQSQSLGTHAAV